MACLLLSHDILNFHARLPCGSIRQNPESTVDGAKSTIVRSVSRLSTHSTTVVRALRLSLDSLR